jgi:decaprenyl-phosphate phosphoribosyltransferase
MELIKLLRPTHWVKNGFLLLPAFFGQTILEPGSPERLLLMFFAFSFTASAVYILNDYVDRDFDRLHPEKCKRPLAAGTVSIPLAFTTLVILLGSAFSILYCLEPWALYFTLAYFANNLGYSFIFKKFAYLDLVFISAGFMLRIFTGAAVANVPVSNWLIVMTFLLAMFLGLAKRRDDLVLLKSTGTVVRESLKGYNLKAVRYLLILVGTGLCITYVIYSGSLEIAERAGGNNVYFTAIFVVLGYLRYLQLIFSTSKATTPTKVIFRDPLIMLLLVGFLATFAIFLYGA